MPTARRHDHGRVAADTCAGMPIVVRSRVIAAPPARVWDVLADIPSQPRWMRDLKRVELIDPGPVRAGTRAVGTVRMFGISQRDPVVIAAFEPERHFAVRHEGTFKGRGDIRLDPLDGGRRTRVLWREELSADVTAMGLPARLRPLASLVDPLLRPVFEWVFRADLRRLARLVERNGT